MTCQNGEVIKLAAYIVKGTGRLEVPEAHLEQSGLRVGHYGDHEFMAVRAEPDSDMIYHFVSQRDWKGRKPQWLSSMALVKPVQDVDGIRLTWNYSSDAIDLPYDRNSGRALTVEVQTDICRAVDQGDELATWFSEHLDFPVRIVKAAGPFYRPARQNYIKNDNTIRFQDGYPIHWFPIESVEELSSIAGYEIPWQTFRPQIVVAGMDAQYEHKVYSGTIAGLDFVDPKPCDRCPVTNVDQNTGDVKVGRAMAPLSRYKNWKNNNGERKIIFGENMLVLGKGPVSIGDKIVTKSHRTPPLIYGATV